MAESSSGNLLRRRSFTEAGLCEVEYTEPSTGLKVYSVYKTGLNVALGGTANGESSLESPCILHFGLSTISSLVCGGCCKHFEVAENRSCAL
jgi:hypothetical protein